mmetsp:Transcript_22694/g.52974  ORF Transcript_22694/g.52974 Transcript_22694/m.52974 type:complete len:181 (-) Transcript_22694:135-677(-)|eukprot:CAMPEP_0178432208 /NCGR_PEP_ID=MMETSP0689_2-20121128/32263_1 /TAXON_ID=160604 /ORGANISM="Amphidinium massartii, Strain CS-259" /LENGTH=180 /DNA_ID=CAMNT_0020054181 /DNA_START=124 /DNA_END=666 /DNA_ORIENTATION=+
MISCGLVRGACRISTRGSLASIKPHNAALASTTRFFAGGGREHLFPDGTRPEPEECEHYHDPEPLDFVPKQDIVTERGRRWLKGVPPKSIEELYGLKQDNLPWYPRTRLTLWGNYNLVMKLEWCYFYIPTIIILGLAVPAFTTIYALEETVACRMTVKVTGRQWYWVYEVESPTDDDEEE